MWSRPSTKFYKESQKYGGSAIIMVPIYKGNWVVLKVECNKVTGPSKARNKMSKKFNFVKTCTKPCTYLCTPVGHCSVITH